MKLVYLAGSAIPSRWANSVHVMKQCQAIAALGHDVTLITPERPDMQEHGIIDPYDFYNVRPNFKLVRTRHIPFPGLTLISMLWTSLRQKPDIFYGRHILLCFMVACLGKKVALELHEPVDGRWRAYTAVKLLSRLPNVRGLVVISDQLRKRIEKFLPHFKGRIMIAHDGADPVTLPAPTALLLKDSFHVGYVGQLYPGKGMEMISQLAPLCPWATFHVVGGYPDDIRNWQEKITGCKNIIFHGFKSQSELPAFMAGFDVVLAPYQQKVHGFGKKTDLASWMSPLKLFEYMAAGKPIICSDLPVLREVMTDGHNCLLCVPDDSKSWQAALRNLLDNPDLKTKLGHAAQKDFLQNYTWDMRAEKIVEFLKCGRTAKPKSTLLLTDDFSEGGAQRVFIHLAYQLAERDIPFQFVVLRGDNVAFKQDFEKLAPEPLLKATKARFNGLSYGLLYMRYIYRHKPRLVMSTLLKSNILNIVVRRLFFWRKMIVIIREANTLHARAQQLGRRAKIGCFIARWTYPLADTVIAPSHGVAKDLAENLRVPPHKITVIYNPTLTRDLQRMMHEPLPEQDNDTEKQGPLFVAAGRLAKAKGFDVLLNAFAEIHKARPSARLLILGEGPDRGKLEAQRQELGLDEAVNMPGFVENPFPYMKAADVFVLSSRWEGLPNVLIQALACGTTPVATNCPSGPDEILENGAYGYLVPVADTRALADKMLYALENPIPKAQLQQRAQMFDEDLIAQQYIELMKQAQA